jgi:transposase InsO family protein
MGPFPTSKSRNQHILVMTEYLTRWYEAESLSDISASTIAMALLKKVIFPHGCPVQLLSDQGPQFKSEVLNLIAKSLGIEQLFTTPYLPQTNGLTERMNQTLKQGISSY